MRTVGRNNGNGSLDKRKACLFVVLVAIAVACVCILIYTLFYAGPRANNTIRGVGQSLLHQQVPGPAIYPAVHS